jgi:DNA (cytosine-5)-methyltransferase 1
MWRDSSNPYDGSISAKVTAPGLSAVPPEVRGDDYAFLRASYHASPSRNAQPFSWVDMFAGCGAMSLGVWEAVVAAGRAPRVALAIDNEPQASSVFRANFPSADVWTASVQELLGTPGTAMLTTEERMLRRTAGKVDLLIGGPPCQGHSDLNNYSRRSDARNKLYSYMARAAYVFDPQSIIIENVQGIAHDSSLVLQYTIVALLEMGYSVSSKLIDVADFGVPQKRRRHVLIASKRPHLHLDTCLNSFQSARRPIRWAIEDLAEMDRSRILDQPSTPSHDNSARIDYLFENGLYDLPNSRRPPCHRVSNHSYGSVYGRMRWDEPSQTVTSGFYSMCMGRYVHPEHRRTLTAHEAARLQFVPDFFSFECVDSRTVLAKLIANAVPPKLAYILAAMVLAGYE